MKMVSGVDAAALGTLVETIYSAAQNHDAWKPVMAMLCQYLHAQSASIRFYAADWSEVVFSATHGFDPGFDASYREHFVHLDPIPSAIDKLQLPSGTMARLDEVIPFGRLRRTAFYNDYMRPQDKRHVMGGYISQGRGSRVLFGLQRGHRSHTFEPRDKQLLELLAPHFQQALRLHQLVTEHKALSNAVNQALDTLEIAAFFVDRTAHVLFASAGGEALLQSGHLVRLRQGQLHTRRRELDSPLQLLIETATQVASTPAGRVGGAIQLAVPSTHSGAITAIVAPWRHTSAFGATLSPRVMAAIFVGSHGRPNLRTQYLTGAYGLTRTEARLAAKLVETCNLEQSGEAIGVARQTARDYLKSIFRKTDCHSQAELIGMILSGPAGLWGRETGSVRPATIKRSRDLMGMQSGLR